TFFSLYFLSSPLYFQHYFFNMGNIWQFIIRFDILPGKMQELDTYLEQEMIPYWTSHKEVRSVEVFEDAFIGWPERMLVVEVDDLSCLERILASPQTRQMKERFTSYATDIQTQIVERVFQKRSA
ncbi:MAG: hypothetical protein K6U11_06635, partial [bacterium]|nr:hypothetical protein [bacterium]